MTEPDAIQIARDYVHSLFPRSCRSCKREFVSFKDFLVNTTPVGEVMSWDAEVGDWQPKQPFGIIAHANCRCGTTLALSTASMPLPHLWRMMIWARLESSRRGITPSAVLTALRDKTVAQELAEPDPLAPAQRQ